MLANIRLVKELVGPDIIISHKIMTSKCVLDVSDPEGGVGNPKMVNMSLKWPQN